MFGRYFSFSGTLTKEEYKSMIISGLKFYAIFAIIVILPAFFMNLTAVGEQIILSVLTVGSAVFLCSMLSVMTRFLNGAKKHKK